VAEAGINTIPLGGFTPGSGYTFHIVVADAAGNLSAALGIPFSPRKLGVDPAKDRAEQNEAALIAAGEIALVAPRAVGGSAQVGITLGEDGRITIVIDGSVTEYPYTVSGDTIIVTGGGDAELGFAIGEDGTLTLEGLDKLAGGGLAPDPVVSDPNPQLTPPPALSPADKAALTAAITAAETLIAGTASGEDAAEVPLGVHFVTAVEKAAYQTAIDAAKAVRDDGAATQAQLDQAALDLAAETGVFSAAAAKTGTTLGPAPILGVTAPSFDGAVYGDERPGAKPITITNSGTAAAAISAVALSGAGKDAFILGGSGTAVSAGGNIATRTVQPAAALAAGTYTATITVSYDGGAAVTATLTVTISKAAPVYTAPTGLSAFAGQTLAEVTLPPGFSWDTVEDPTATPVGNAGSNPFTVTYTPGDTDNYRVVADIPVVIAVTAKTLAITVSLNLSHELILTGIPPGGITLSGDETATISATGYTKVKWYVDGNEAAGEALSDGGDSITLKATAYDARRHQVLFRGVQDGSTYSKEISFTVSE
jgi:hypothetical protein